MEPETDKNTAFFSIKSSLHQEAYKIKEVLYKNNKWQLLSIHQSEKLLKKLHPDILQDDFPETSKIFESNSLMVYLPEEINV